MPTAEENFEALMAWLGPDRMHAGEKYLHIRQSLIHIFTWRGVDDSAIDELADETFNRVTEKIREIGPTYRGDPALFFLGVARRVLQEYFRTIQHKVPLTNEIIAHLPAKDSDDETAIKERFQECLMACFDALSSEEQALLKRYFSKTKQAKIDGRKALAQELGVSINSLRVRVHRIRESLHNCLMKCLERVGTSEDRD